MWAHKARPVSAVATLLLSLAAGLSAQAPPPRPRTPVTPPGQATDEPRSPLRQDEDEPDLAPLTVGRWLSIGGSFQTEFDGGSGGLGGGDRTSELESGAQLKVLVTPRRWLRLFGKANLARTVAFARGAAPEGGWQPDVQEAYAEVTGGEASPVSVAVGRQRFRDGQEWFFDEYLDAVRVKARAGRWRFDVAYADSLTSRPDEARSTSERRHLVASVSRRVTRAARATGFLVRRDDRSSRGDEPVWLGATVASRGERVVTFRALGALRRGHAAGIRLRGWAADGAVTVRAPWGWSPRFTAGYARASGDASTADGVDAGFRQTGLQDNATRFGTWRRMRMYGEVFDPELANLRVLTFAAAVRPARWLGIESVVHEYRQAVVRRRLGETAFDVRPNGLDGRLGREVDVQVVARLARRVDLLTGGGVFFPGAGFDGVAGGDRRTAIWRSQLRVSF